MKLANWNLERASTSARRDALREYTDKIAADVWVFTETHRDFTPGLTHSCSSAEGRDGLPKLDTPAARWVMIWSKYPMKQLATSDPIRTAAARIFPSVGMPFLVFGTVLPWGGDKWRGHPSAGGVAFREALALQKSDWLSLRQKYPDDEFFVMGDFNEDLASTRYYGSQRNKAALVSALNECGLVALTAGNDDPIRRDSAPYACIDHICALRDSGWYPEPAKRWPESPKPNKRLSDHFGVSVTFTELSEDERQLVEAGCKELKDVRLQKLRDKDFLGYLLAVESKLRFHQFVKIAPMLSPGQYWQLLREVWMIVEVIQPNKRKWLSLLRSKRKDRQSLMTQKEHATLANLPDELKIWRGCGHEDGVRGLSWTLDRKCAEFFASYACGHRRAFFANSLHGSEPIIVEATCHKSDVLAFFMGRNESEIVVNPKNVTVLRTFAGDHFSNATPSPKPLRLNPKRSN